MKFVALIAVAVLATFALFSNPTGAEQADEQPQMMTKTYDLAPYFMRPQNVPPVIPPGAEPQMPPDDSDTPPDVEMTLELIRRLAHWDAVATDEMIMAADYKVIVTNTLEKIRALDEAMALYLPKRWHYNLRLATLLKETPDPAFLKPIERTYAEAFADLKAVGFASTFDTQFSAAPGRTVKLSNERNLNYVADQDGLIATFARATDPVMGTLALGCKFTMRLSEVDNAIQLDVAFSETRLKQMRVITQNGDTIEEPELARTSWRRQVIFTHPGTKALSYWFDGTACVLLIELEE
ncbi:MAG: hypothetical protein WC712_12885 [Candidatus Brocadiia bacterium]